jgi:hypothetical protein
VALSILTNPTYSYGMSHDMDEILKRVAAGELTPEEALRHLDGGRQAGSQLWTEEPPGPRTEDRPRPAAATDGVTAIRITASYRNLDVIADPSVATAFAEGEHSIVRDGGVLVVDGRGGGLLGNGLDPHSWRFGLNAVAPGRALSRGWWDHNLTVRVNPQLPLQLDAVGSKLRVRGGEAGGELRLAACSVGLDTFRGPVRIEANSSSIKGGLAPVGESRIAAEQSSVKVALLPGSDVRIRVRNRMSKVVLPERIGRSKQLKQEFGESVVGAGTGELGLDAVMSSVVLVAELGYGAWS